jgi:ribosomal-protein-alanine N-acetyltransferase
MALALTHAMAFDTAWDCDQITSLLAGPGAFGSIVERGEALAGFVLGRVAADEAEILTLAVAPAHRRRGVGAALLAAAAAEARAKGASALFLEVASDNCSALALYVRAGFVAAGARKGYYDHGGGTDALVLRLDLNSGGPPPYHHRRSSS